MNIIFLMKIFSVKRKKIVSISLKKSIQIYEKFTKMIISIRSDLIILLQLKAVQINEKSLPFDPYIK